MKFEDWFNEVENFGLRSERFFDDLSFSMVPAERDRVMVQWLRAAFAAGRREQDQIDTISDSDRAAKALVELSSLAADFKSNLYSDGYVKSLIGDIVDNLDVPDRENLRRKALKPWFLFRPEDIE